MSAPLIAVMDTYSLRTWDTPADTRFRRRTPEDVRAVASVLIADQREEVAEPVLGVSFIRQQWSRTGFDLAADAWVVTDGSGAIVGYGQVWRDEPDAVESWGVVHRDHRGRGIGSALLDRIETRASVVLARGRVTTLPTFDQRGRPRGRALVSA